MVGKLEKHKHKQKRKAKTVCHKINVFFRNFPSQSNLDNLFVQLKYKKSDINPWSKKISMQGGTGRSLFPTSGVQCGAKKDERVPA